MTVIIRPEKAAIAINATKHARGNSNMHQGAKSTHRKVLCKFMHTIVHSSIGT